MRQGTKRSLALLLCLVLLGTLLPALPAQAEEIEIIPIETPIEAEPVGEEEIVLIGEEPAEPTGTKPAITTQPASVTKTVGDTAKFKVVASGATSYQWYWRKDSSASWAKSTLTGNTTATLSVEAKTSRDGYQYRCKVSNSSGYVYSSAATLTVTAKPVITTQPTSKTVSEGTTAKFTVKASGATAYQWYWRKNSSASWAKSTLSGNKSATLSVKATAARDGYQYRCRVSNANGYVYSKAATLTVLSKPVITAQPVNVIIKEEETAKFTVKATGATAYQWYYRTSSTDSWHKSTLSTATKATLSLTAKTSRNGYQYRCRVSNDQGYVYSKAATLTVEPGLPVIVTEPVSVSVQEGATVSFTVAAKNAESYQWYWWKESTGAWVAVGAASGKTATLTYTDVDFAWDGYLFCCKVSNSKGSVWTDDVELALTGRIAPIIKTHPTGAYIKEGGTASFTVSARHAESYQWYWYKESEDGWVPISTASAKTATLTYTEVPYSWNEYWFRCKVSNSAGDTWSDSARIRITERTEPAITGWPLSRTVESGFPTSFSVTAKYADGYQWYWRKNSSSDWNAIAKGTSATLSYAEVTTGWSGYQFRCKVYNSLAELYTPVATLTVTPANISYRALLVSESDFFGKTTDLPETKRDVANMAAMLGAVKGPAGGSYAVTERYDIGKSELESAIANAFSGADDNDVSLFFISTHGATGFATGEHAGELLLIGASSNENMTFRELADCLNKVPGKIIVFIDSCGSGSAIYEANGSAGGAEEAFDPEAFNEAAIDAFAALDPVANTGELRSSKYYVLTAAAHQEMSWASSTLGYSHFSYHLCQGVLGDKPADTDGNGTVTLSELYDYVYEHALGPYTALEGGNYVTYYQHAQVYPENSGYALFK